MTPVLVAVDGNSNNVVAGPPDYMLKRLISLCVFFLSYSLIVSADETSDLAYAQRLWDKAVAAVERGAVFLPSMIESLTEELDAKGTLLSSNHAIHALNYEPDNPIPVSTLIKSEQNGQDNTDDRRITEESAKDEQNTQSEQSQLTTPLDKEAQAGIKLLSIQIENSEAYIAYELEAKTQSYTGTVKIDTELGYPLEVKQSLKKRPLFVPNMEMRLIYNLPIDRDGPAATISKARFDAEASILFFKKIVRSELRFLEYIPAPVSNKIGSS